MTERTITVGHSPDADDAFMFYALARGKIPTGNLKFDHTLQDIETLNRRAEREELDLTALSVHAYAHVADKYALLACGASVGDGYGPIVVAKKPMTIERLRDCRIAIPGEWTTAFLTARLCLGKFNYSVIPFDQVFDAVLQDRADAGLVIHEGQLTYSDVGLHRVIDLGNWWGTETGLPLPLGVNGIRKTLGRPLMEEISQYLKAGIEYALAHREEALGYALRFAPDLDRERADRFVGMYVNDFTVDLGEKGKRSISALLERAEKAGLLPKRLQAEFVG